MKPLIQKLPLAGNTSFLAKTFKTPDYEVPWHQHIEYELILFTRGNGMCFLGNYVGEYKTGDVFFIGSNVPHAFPKQEEDMMAAAIVIQFTEDFWGKDFLLIPENNTLRQLFSLSKKGIKFQGPVKQALARKIKVLETASEFLRISTLINCLQLMVDEKKLNTLSSSEMFLLNTKHRERLNNTFAYTIQNFQQPISLKQIAGVANMSVTAFCAYFKKSAKKSYIDFLNETRINYACRLLQDTDKPIIDICYESGFNTSVNFNRQFLKIKKMPPSKFRTQFTANALPDAGDDE